VSASHISTQQWQSFEMRMRQRRADRCLLRAEVALEAGFEEDARQALAEAKQLDRRAPDFDVVEARVRERLAAAAEADRAARLSRNRRMAVAAALFVSVIAGGATLMRRGASNPPSPLTVASAVPSTPAADAATATGAPIDTGARGPIAPSVPPQQTSALEAPAAALPPLTTAPVTEALPPPGAAAAVTRPVVTEALPPAPPDIAPPVVTSSVPATLGEVSAVPGPPPAVPAIQERRPETERGTTTTDEQVRVRAVLARYAAAYSDLDASAAQAVWPEVDARSLARAFDGLQSQRVSLGQCSIAVDGATARADCDGSATWTPKIGGGTRSQPRQWHFELKNNAGTWEIVKAQGR
jgi:hypothetical protein